MYSKHLFLDQENKILDNKELIKEGNDIIIQFLKEEFQNYPDDVINSLIKYLTSDDMLSHVAKHLGLTDLVFTSVSGVF